MDNRRIREMMRSHGDAVYYLNLPCRVVEPTSLWQIQIGGRAELGTPRTKVGQVDAGQVPCERGYVESFTCALAAR